LSTIQWDPSATGRLTCHDCEPDCPEAEGLSTKHNTEKSRSHDARREHDRKSRQYETRTSNPWHQSNGARIAMGVLAVIVVASLTLLFVGGVIRW
jgi:hypothetical protein